MRRACRLLLAKIAGVTQPLTGALQQAKHIMSFSIRRHWPDEVANMLSLDRVQADRQEADWQTAGPVRFVRRQGRCRAWYNFLHKRMSERAKAFSEICKQSYNAWHKLRTDAQHTWTCPAVTRVCPGPNGRISATPHDCCPVARYQPMAAPRTLRMHRHILQGA